MKPHTKHPGGSVLLVGAGPGDPALASLAARRALAEVDAVLITRPADRRLAEASNPSIEVVFADALGPPQTDGRWPLAAVAEWLARRAVAGQKVALLLPGDPASFPHTVALLDRLAAANPEDRKSGSGGEGLPAATGETGGYEIRLVSGVGDPAWAAAEAVAPVTHPDFASAVTFVEIPRPDEEMESITRARITALADVPGTLAVSVDSDVSPTWVPWLLEGGASPELPALVLMVDVVDEARPARSAASPIRTTLGQLAGTLTREAGQGRAVVLIGKAIGRHWAPASQRQQPLRGKAILIARPVGQADELADRLDRLGADVWLQPAIEIGDPPDWEPVDAAIDRFEQYTWLVFSSVNGVERMLGRIAHRGDDPRRALAHLRLAAIGPSTARSLESVGLRADLVPESYRAESLANALIEALADSPAPRRVLLARASRGREILAEMLRAEGIEVDQVVVYTSADVRQARPAVAEAVRAGRINWVLVTSSAIARSLARLFGDELTRVRLASISPVTSATLRELGLEPSVEADEYTTDGLIAAIIAAEDD